MENKKYEMLMDDSVTVEYENETHTLYRIRALRDFGNISKGTIGGYIESEKNLSHNGNCWVEGNAKVYGDACVYENAWVSGEAKLYGSAEVYGDAEVYGMADVYGNACVYDNARIYDNAWAHGTSVVRGSAEVYGDAGVHGLADVHGDACVGDNAEVYGTTEVYGVAEVVGEATVRGEEDYIVFKNWWSSGRYFTWTRSNNMWKVGCFYGTGEELIKKAYADSERSGREYERIVKYVEEIVRDEKE